jgi:immune inhibitor A
MTRFICEGSFQKLTAGLVCLFVAALLVAPVPAMPPHPDLLKAAAAKGNPTTASVYISADAREAGVCAPDDFFKKYIEKKASSDVQLSPTAGSFRILALLVDFSDHAASVAPAFYDSLVFGSVGNTIKDYFDDISYGQLDLVTVNQPSSLGWQRAPQTYAYYVNGEKGIGSPPTNSQGLVADLVDLVDPIVDFSQYDNDGDGFVDVLLVIHSGTGAEMSGSFNDIHSHKWSLTAPRSKDGVNIYSYTVQPEFWLSPGDMTIGVYSHELCHGFGLPDLYDTDYSSNGIGDWGIMSFGSWNGPGGRGGSPANPCAWSRIEMGFASPTVVTSNVTGQAIGAVETGGAIFRLPSSGPNSEYFLVENRRRIGYDAYLPSEGLLIWHIDEAKTSNDAEWWPGQFPTSSHYLVALEQADGLFTLEQSDIYGNTGDAGDPFPGTSSNTSFNNGTTPNSDSYSAGSAITSVNNISAPAATMYADLIVGTIAAVDDYTQPELPNSIELSQNYPNPFNPNTFIEFSLERGAEVELIVYNLLGRKVKTLIDGYTAPGTTRIEWDATADGNSELASGVYFYKLSVEDKEQRKKMLLIR